MPTLLCRELTRSEQVISHAVKKMLANRSQAPRRPWQELGLRKPDAVFATVMSMIQIPPSTGEERALCGYLLATPEFLSFLSRAETFDHPSLVLICRTLLAVDPRFDARLASSLFSDTNLETASILRVLSVLDEVSPGGRLNFILTHLARDSGTAVAAKIALLLGRRISNIRWVERQLTSADARLRANVVEALWGVDTYQARGLLSVALNDSNNRVVGNALYGLHLLNEPSVPARLRALLDHSQPLFRATAAWVMGKAGERRYFQVLLRASDDPDERVREAARRALALMPAEQSPSASAGETAEAPMAPKDEPDVQQPVFVPQPATIAVRNTRVVG